MGSRRALGSGRAGAEAVSDTCSLDSQQLRLHAERGAEGGAKAVKTRKSIRSPSATISDNSKTTRGGLPAGRRQTSAIPNQGSNEKGVGGASYPFALRPVSCDTKD
jgi:hypothetical protein